MNKLALILCLVACGGSKPTPSSTTPPAPAPDLPAMGKPMAPPIAPPVVASGNPRNDLIPREILLGNPERINVQVSPDGKHLSWLAPKDGVMNVWVAPLG